MLTAREQLIQEGRLEGIQEGKLEVAHNMLYKGIDPKTIAELTGLIPEIIGQLIQTKDNPNIGQLAQSIVSNTTSSTAVNGSNMENINPRYPNQSLGALINP